jgi:hypothetical protein
MRLQEAADVASGQGNPILGVFPGVKAQLCFRGEECRFHGHGVRVCRDVIGQDQYGCLAVRKNARVTVKTKSALERYILPRTRRPSAW